MQIRRHAAAWLAALGMLATSIGGSVALLQIVKASYCRAELQGEADRAAMEIGNAIAVESRVIPTACAEASRSVTLGLWEANRRQFLPDHVGTNAVEVTVRGTVVPASNNWISPLLASDRLQGKTRAVAAIRPRNIVFVVDLSGAMTSETWASVASLLRVAAEDSAYTEDGELRQLYSDLGFESYPGKLEPFGAPWQVGEGREAFDALVSEEGPLADLRLEQRCRIHRDDSLSTRRRKVYQAVIDQQIIRVMPQVRPDPLVPENFEYWAEYLDEVLSSDGHARIGYASYLRFMLQQGRNMRAGCQHVALSLYSKDPAWHSEFVDGHAFQLPPRTQPMHEVRRGLLMALADVASRNRDSIPAGQRDRVAIVTFDSLSPEGAWVEQPFTNDYRGALDKSARLQAVGRRAQTATSLAALQLAEKLLQQEKRYDRNASQQVVLVTANGARDGEMLQRQTVQMARLGQDLTTISVGLSPERVSPLANTRQIATWRGWRPECSVESSLRASVSSVSVVLVQ